MAFPAVEIGLGVEVVRGGAGGLRRWGGGVGRSSGDIVMEGVVRVGVGRLWSSGLPVVLDELPEPGKKRKIVFNSIIKKL